MDLHGSANARPRQSPSRRETDPTYSAYPAPQTAPGYYWGSGHYASPRATQSAPMPAYPLPQAPYRTVPPSYLLQAIQAPPPEPPFVAVNPFDTPSPRWRRLGPQTPQNPVTTAEMPPAWPMQPSPPTHAFERVDLIPPVIPEGSNRFAGGVPTSHSRSRSRGRSPTRIPHVVPESRHPRSPPRGVPPYPVPVERSSPSHSRRSRHSRSRSPVGHAAPEGTSAAERQEAPPQQGVHMPVDQELEENIRLLGGSVHRSREEEELYRLRSRAPVQVLPPSVRLAGVEEEMAESPFSIASASIAESREDLHTHSPGRASRRSHSPQSEVYSSKSRGGRSRSKLRSRSQNRPASLRRRSTSRRSHSRSPRRSRSPRSHTPSVRRRPSGHGHSRLFRSTVEQGVGKYEAKYWHRRAYDSLDKLGQMQPAEIGHAAAYEAYRTWTHHSSRDDLIGLAVAEASRLLQFANRSMDNDARTAASESAAATASIIFELYHVGSSYSHGSRGHSPQITPVISPPSQVPTTVLHPYHSPEKLPAGESLPLPNTSSPNRRQPFASAVLTLQTIMLTTLVFLFDFVPRQAYLHFLLRIPSLYFSRVTRIFEDARLSLPDIKRMARAKAEQWNTTNPPASSFPMTPDQMPLPQTLLHFRASWEGFIDSLMREWKTLNIVSVLLMSAILTMLQIEAASHPITRTSALFSLICALMSLLYGCMYIVRFGGMRKMHKASSFAEEAQKGTTSIWWNVWVLLAMPAAWLAWSIIMFLTSIMSFVWLSGSSQDPVDFSVSPRVLLGLRIALTLVFALGILYFVLIVKTFHRYGDPLDREWRRRVDQWTKEMDPYYQQQQLQQQQQPIIIRPTSHPSRSTSDSRGTPSHSMGGILAKVAPSRSTSDSRGTPSPSMGGIFSKVAPSRPLTTHPPGFIEDGGARLIPPVHPITLMKLGNPDVQAPPVTGDDNLRRFMLDVSSAWNGEPVLITPFEDANTDLPSRTLLAGPETPVLTSSAPAGNPLRNRVRSMFSSKLSSYGRPQPSTSSISGAPPSPSIAESAASGTAHGQRAFASAASPDDSEKDIPPVQPPPNSPLGTVQDLIRLWNERHFHPRELEALVVPGVGPEGAAEFAVNLVSRPAATNHDNSHDPRSDTKDSPEPGASGSTQQEEEEEQ